MTTLAKTLAKWAIGVLLAFGLGWWAWSTFAPTSDEKIAVAEAEKKRRKEEAAAEAKLVAQYVDSVVAARPASIQTGTVIREILTQPDPPRAPTPTNLPALTRDSLVGIIRTKDAELDKAAVRYAELRAAVVADSLADAKLTRQQDSIIAAQARQITAHQGEIAADNTIIAVQECRVLGLLECPSRKVVAVVSAAGGVALGIWGDDLIKGVKKVARGSGSARVGLSISF